MQRVAVPERTVAAAVAGTFDRAAAQVAVADGEVARERRRRLADVEPVVAGPGGATGVALDSKLTTSPHNEYAAVPSLHAGFALAVSASLAAAARHRIARAAAWLWAPAVALAVVASGNHFVTDIAAGFVVTAAGYGLARAATGLRGRSRGARGRRPLLAASG